MGRTWEKENPPVQNVLAALLSRHGSQLDDESLHTFMIEAEAIVNCRPLALQWEDLYCKRRWRRIQHLANEFWLRWKTDFLQSLQSRQKWIRPRRNMQAGDVVIMKEDNLPQNQWHLARVTEVLPSDDRLVRKVRVMVADPTLDKDSLFLATLLNWDRGSPSCSSQRQEQ